MGKGLPYTPRGQGHFLRSALGSALFCLLDGPAELALEVIHIEELCVVNGADRLFSCLDERFPDLELDLSPREKDFGAGRTGTLRPSPTLYRSQE